MTTVLSIDQGTSGTKAVVVDSEGAILGLAEQTVRPHYLAGSGVEQNPQELLDSVLQAGRSAVAQSAALIDIVTIARRTGAPASLSTVPDTVAEPAAGAVVARGGVCCGDAPTANASTGNVSVQMFI